MGDLLVAIAVGFASGALSGAFGIGGGILTTPAIRLLMAAPALVAVGTPLPVIIPSAITGGLQYRREGLVDGRSAGWMAFGGVSTAAIGAIAATRVGGSVVLLATVALIAWAAADMSLQVVRPRSEEGTAEQAFPPRVMTLLVIGAVGGLYSGFFGLGGGFVLIPLMTRWLRFPIKRAIGTSLVTVAMLAVPGTVTHAVLGNIDWTLAAGLALGVVPGAWLGARISIGAADRSIRIGFAALLVAVGAWLAVNEVAGLLS